ncbi:MMPL domain-containing protein [Planctomycetales bacterium 10988]|nr:MMPL domain-containing protein [Planctomycetales bacterium 10988]
MFSFWSPRIVEAWVRWRVGLFLVALLLFVMAIYPAQQLSFDRSIETMFAPDDPILVPFRELRETFGGDQVVLVVYQESELLTDKGLQEVETLQNDLKEVGGVRAVVSILDTPANMSPAVPAAQPILKLFEGFLINENKDITALLCLLETESERKSDTNDSAQTLTNREIVADIRRISYQHRKDAVIAGEPVMVSDGFAYLEEDGERLGYITTGLLMLVILIFFRSLRWMIIPLIVVQAALIWTQAALVLSSFQLSMVSSMLTAIVTVIGIATVIHLIVRFRDARSEQLDPKAALIQAGLLVLSPIMWACSTDAVGFAALGASRVGPVQSFGIMMALGALFTAVAFLLIIPAVVLWGRRDTDPKRVWGEQHLDFAFRGLNFILQTKPWKVWAIFLLLVGICISGYPRLKMETDFTKNFREGSPIVSSYQYVEQNFGGAGVWDVVLTAPEPLTKEFLQKARKLEMRLRNEVKIQQPDGTTRPGLTKVLSLVDALDAGDEVAGSFLSRFTPMKVKLNMMREQAPPFFDSLYAQHPDKDQSSFRIMLRSYEQQSTEDKINTIKQVRKITEEEFPGKAEVTGFFVLLAYLIQSLLGDQWITFSFAGLGIGLMLWLAFRSLSLSLIALVPNVLPIVMVLGLMGHLGLKINMGTVMIASVSLGLSVDSSIHYLLSYQRHREEGKSILTSIQLVQDTVGRAMFFSTLALIVGFSALCFSQFVPTIYFGFLVSLAMLGGLIGNLILLPFLLLQFYSDQPSTEVSEQPSIEAI